MPLAGRSHALSGEAPPLRRYPWDLCRNTGHRTLVAIFASVWLPVFQNTTSMSNPFRGSTVVGYAIAYLTVRWPLDEISSGVNEVVQLGGSPNSWAVRSSKAMSRALRHAPGLKLGKLFGSIVGAAGQVHVTQAFQLGTT